MAMKGAFATGTWGVLALLVAGAGGRDDKAVFRYRFEKGQKLALEVRYAVRVKLEKVPEVFQGLLSETPADLKIEGLLETEVGEVSAEGGAALEGRWKRLSARGGWMLGEVDFQYDAEKGGGAPKKAAAGEAPPALFDLEEGLRAMARESVRFFVEPSGRVRMRSAGAPMVGEMSEQFLSFNGLMGPFPKDPLGKGDSWKGEEKIAMPGVGGTMSVGVRSENRYESDESAGGRPCAVLRSKYSVGGEGVGRKEDPDQPLPFRLKTSGEGEAQTWFCLEEGMSARHQGNLRADLVVGIPDPGGGGDIELRMGLRIEQGYEVKR